MSNIKTGKRTEKINKVLGAIAKGLDVVAKAGTAVSKISDTMNGKHEDQ